MAEGYFDHSERRLSGALDGAAEAVDWPAFGNRLGRRLADVRPRRRSAWDILAVGAHLAAATALFAVAVWLGAAWFRYSAYHPDRSEPAIAASAHEARPAVEVQALSPRSGGLQDLLAQLPAGLPQEAWINGRLR